MLWSPLKFTILNVKYWNFDVNREILMFYIICRKHRASNHYHEKLFRFRWPVRVVSWIFASLLNVFVEMCSPMADDVVHKVMCWTLFRLNVLGQQLFEQSVLLTAGILPIFIWPPLKIWPQVKKNPSRRLMLKRWRNSQRSTCAVTFDSFES